MTKFKVGDTVLVQYLNKEGQIVGIFNSLTLVEYVVAVPRPNILDHGFGIIECVGVKYERVRVIEEMLALYADQKKELELCQTFYNKNIRSNVGIESIPFSIKIGLSDKSCECGKDNHGFACHSTWCPKYE